MGGQTGAKAEWRARLRMSGALGATAVCLAVASPAQATRSIATGFSELPTSGAWLDRAVQAKARIARVNVSWRDIVTHRPQHPRDPADPAYNFNGLDQTVKAIHSRGLKIMMTVVSAPNWAEGRDPPKDIKPGSWKPSPKPFGDFGHALAKRYSGSFPNTLTPLPRVRYFEAWAEPNLRTWLSPQWHGKKPKSPGRYRRLLNAFYDGVKSAEKGDRVIGGVTAPFGDRRGGKRMRPLQFLRGLFCFKITGALRKKHCSPKPHLDILSHHPIDRFRGPGHHAYSRYDATVPDMPRVRRLVGAARRAGNVRPKGKIPLWATEFWWESDPPDHRYGVRVRKQARWVEEALYLFWKAGVDVALNLQLQDSAFEPSISSYQTGIFFHNGTRKPAYTAFRFPFVSHRRSHHGVKIWGKSPGTGKLHIERRKHGDWRSVKALSAKSGRVFTTRIRLPGGAELRGRVAGETSLAWHQGG
jgi:hypothetical protein